MFEIEVSRIITFITLRYYIILMCCYPSQMIFPLANSNASGYNRNNAGKEKIFFRCLSETGWLVRTLAEEKVSTQERPVKNRTVGNRYEL